MGYSYGDLYYNYKIKIDLEDLIDKIIDELKISYDNWHFEDSCVVIEGNEKCRYKHWHCNATRLDPPEDETELYGSIDDMDIDHAVLDAVSKYKEWLLNTRKYITECEIDEDSYDYIPDELDVDAIYDAYRDRTLE